MEKLDLILKQDLVTNLWFAEPYFVVVQRGMKLV